MDWDKKKKKECNCRIKIEKSKVWIICDNDNKKPLKGFKTVEINENTTLPNEE